MLLFKDVLREVLFCSYVTVAERQVGGWTLML